MIKSYFIIAWRNLLKQPLFSVINILGLSMGIAFALLIGAFVWSELQVNRQLRNHERQFFLESDWKDPNMGNTITSVGPLARRLKEEYPNLVANYYRWDGITSVVSKGEKHFRENIQLGDSTLLSMFGFRLLHGDAGNALTQPFSVVVTEDIAIKYFGRTDVVGESISIQSFSGGLHAFSITGVLAPLTENAVTQLNPANHNQLYIPTNTFSYFGRTDFESWANLYLPSYVELQPGVTASDLAGPIKHLLAVNAPAQVKENLTVRPQSLQHYYLNANKGLAKRMLYTLAAIGLFIVLMALINFVNIAISSSGRRTREIGVRKVLGGLRSQLMVQFLAESFILVSLATAIAVAVYPLVAGAFAGLVGKPMPALNAFPLYFLALPLVLIILLSLLAGGYPAFVLSSLGTVTALKGKLKTVGGHIMLRKSLVAFQFSVALLVMVAAIIISQQVSYFFGQGLGYNKEYVVSSQVPRDWSRTGVQKMLQVRNEFARLPGVTDVSLSYEIPNGMNGGSPPVYPAGADSTTAIPMQAMVTDERYLATYQVSTSAGSFFEGHDRDSAKLVMNEQAIQALGFKNPQEAVGRQVRIPGDPTLFTIKGVTRNFHFGSMQATIPAIVFFNINFANTYRYLSFRLAPGKLG
ncbi:MAG TPA: ABC transporter permease, partial [Chitinophagaceae bacterium]|nr:ABC transporter permease [Chitinophagaceae bacterium]